MFCVNECCLAYSWKVFYLQGICLFTRQKFIAWHRSVKRKGEFFLKSKTLKSKEIIRLFTIIWSRVYRLNGSDPPPYCGFRSVAGSSVMSVRRIRCDREPRFGRLSNGFTWFSLIIADLKGPPLDSSSTPLQPSFSANHAQSNFNYKHQLLAFEVLSSFVFKRSFGELIDFFE